jgi:hypothetical protein
MTNEFSGHIAHRLCRIAALEHENHKNNYDLRVLPCSATNSMHSSHPKTHPSWVKNESLSQPGVKGLIILAADVSANDKKVL